MRHRLFNLASIALLLLCLLSACNSLFTAYIAAHEGGAESWDEVTQAWVPETRGELNRQAAFWGVSAVALGIVPGLWLKRFLRQRHERHCSVGGTCSCGKQGLKCKID